MLKIRILVVFLVALLLAAPSFAQNYPPAWNTTVSYAAGDQVQINGNIFRAIKASTKGKFIYSEWEMYYVRNNSTYMIGTGQTFATLQAAWAFFANCHIAGSAYLHLYISTAHGNHSETLSKPLNLDHPCGGQISIIGDSMLNITLNFTSANGVTIDNGHAFGAIQNMVMKGSTGSGIMLSGNATISSITGVDVYGSGIGLLAMQNASVYLDGGVRFYGVSTVVQASQNAVIRFGNGFVYSGFGNTAEAILCLVAYDGGTIIAQECTISFVPKGATAYQGGMIDVSVGTFEDCVTAVQSYDHGTIDALLATFSTNSTWDIQAYSGGVVEAKGANFSLSSAGGSGDGSYIYQ
jgi:hypothetical protein